MHISRQFARTAGHRGNAVLSNDDLVRFAPSVMAVEAHSSRTERFRPIPTLRVIDAMRAEGFVPVFATQSRSRDESKLGFTKHMLRFRRVQDMERPATTRKIGDTYAEAVLVNANDGTSSYKLYSGLFRLVCLNGMVTQQPGGVEVTVGHRGSQDDVARKVIEGTYEVLGQADRNMIAAETWGDVALAEDEQRALAEAAHAIRFPEAQEAPYQAAITPDHMLRTQRWEDRRNDLWTTFNRVQENMIQGGLEGSRVDEQGRRRNVTTRAVNGIDQNVGLNRALWMLTQRMAEIRGVPAA